MARSGAGIAAIFAVVLLADFRVPFFAALFSHSVR